MPGKLPMSSLTEAIVETITQPLLVLDGELRVKAANRAFLQHFGVEPAETLGCLVYDLGNGQWNIPGLRRLLEEVLSQNGQVVDYRVEHDFESIGERIMLLNGTRMRREDTTDTILLAITDITERERLRFELEGQKEFTEKLIDSVRESLVVLGWDLRVHFANHARKPKAISFMSSATGSGIFPSCASFWKKFCPERTLSTTTKWNISSSRLASGPCCSTPAASIT